MEKNFNTAAIKCLEAAKLIAVVKDPKVTERRDDICRRLWQISAELLLQEGKGTDKNK